MHLRVLIRSSEPSYRKSLAYALRTAGYCVDQAYTEAAALTKLSNAAYDAFIFDLDDMKLDPVCLMQDASKLQPSLQILIVTSEPTLRTAIGAVRIKAADYLLKPLEVKDIVEATQRALQVRLQHRREMTAMIQEALRAVAVEEVAFHDTVDSDPVIIVPPYRLDCTQRQVTRVDREEKSVRLTRGETAVLASLMAHPDEPLSTKDMARSAWNYELEPGEAGELIRPYISRLRRKLEQQPKRPRRIVTVRGQGYLFVSRQAGLSSD